MAELNIGDDAYVIIAETGYHGKIVTIRMDEGKPYMYELEVPDYGIFYISPRQILKENT